MKPTHLKLGESGTPPVHRLECEAPTKTGWYYAARNSKPELIEPWWVWQELHGTKLRPYDSECTELSDFKWFGPVAECLEVKDER